MIEKVWGSLNFKIQSGLIDFIKMLDSYSSQDRLIKNTWNSFRKKNGRNYEEDLKILHLIRGGLGAPLQLICQSVLVTYGIIPLTTETSSNLRITDWQGNVISITMLFPASIALSVVTVFKVQQILYWYKNVFKKTPIIWYLS